MTDGQRPPLHFGSGAADGRLGRAHSSTTLDSYAQLLDQAEEEAAVALGALLNGSTGTSADTTPRH